MKRKRRSRRKKQSNDVLADSAVPAAGGAEAPSGAAAEGDSAAARGLPAGTFLKGSPYFLAVVLVCAIGIGIAIELTRVYVLSHTDPHFESFCALSEGVNCEQVAASAYATTLGVINSVWAMFAYAWLLGLALWGMRRRGRDTWPQGVMLAVSSLQLIVSAVLFYIMKVVIGSLCVLCLGLDIVNVALFILVFARWRATARDTSPVALVASDILWIFKRPLALVGTLAVTIAMLLGVIEYSHHAQEQIAQAGRQRDPLSSIGPEEFLTIPAARAAHQCEGPDCEQCRGYGSGQKQLPVTMGKDERGHQWIGAADPKIIIEEFTDYECPYCRKAHLRLRAAMSHNPTVLRVVHRNYPLDIACNKTMKRQLHQRACLLAKVALCAGEQGRFWEMNDFLFMHAKTIKEEQISAAELARRLELDLERFQCCLSDSATAEHLEADLQAGHDLGLTGTPAYVVDGTVKYGSPPESVLRRLSAP